jgi:large subunit ribosomal protein L3
MTAETKSVTGLLGTKLGMTQAWDENNRVVPITVVEAGESIITQIKTLDTDGYAAIQIAYGAIDPRKADKPTTGHFEKAGATPRRYLAEIRTPNASDYSVGQALGVDVFEVGSKVDVVGTSKGKGFAGVMKRHGFGGIHSSHGAHKNHRKPGSIGAGTTPSRVLKGKRMAGRMGTDRVTTLNLTLHGVDLEKGLLLIKGAVPGPKGQLVFVRNAVKESK